ncbi:MAG TPA: class I SAM-dependent methyltransferase [Hanamia sp.]
MMSISEIQSHFEEIEKDVALLDEKNFDQRMEAIDFIEFCIIDQVEMSLQKTGQPNELILLRHRAGKIKLELEKINVSLFQKIRANIRRGEHRGKRFRDLVDQYVNLHNEQRSETGYDNLDIFINGLFSLCDMPELTTELQTEMVYYQKTPARIVFEMVEKVHFTSNDIFFDLGSGLGQAAILVNLLTGARAIGVEFEPAFSEYAQNCAGGLNIPVVTFLNVDAREADYSEGTVFFMFTPFIGKMLQEVLELLKKESLLRKIKIITYGPCTAMVASQSWLTGTIKRNNDIYKLAFFNSF